MKRLLGLLVLAWATFPAATTQAEQNRPNVLFIAVDDLKPAIGAFGDKRAVTPNLDRLAGMGTAFLNAHCQQAICGPSRVSLLLGLRPDATRVWDLQTKFRDTTPDAVTLPQRFKQAGYTTVGMGKIFDVRSTPGPRDMDAASWSEPYTVVSSPAVETFSYRNPDTVAHVERVLASGRTQGGWEERLKTIFPEGKPATDRANVPDNAYHDGAMTELAIERLDGFAESGESFFLAVGFNKPHLPFNAPAKYWDLYDRDDFTIAPFQQDPQGAPPFATQPGWELRFHYDVPKEGPISEARQLELIHGYYAATSYVDAQVGRLLDALEANGQLDGTVIVLWGDHGWHLGDHDMWCKHTNYEQATRSPLIVAAPGVGRAGSRGRAPVEFVDVYPTLLDLAGIEPAGPLHGVSLRPILEDPQARVKDAAVSQYPRQFGDDHFMGYAYRTDRFRLVQWRARDTNDPDPSQGPVVATELYDYAVDPLETRNLADDPAYAQARTNLEALARGVE